ncbi:2-dehydro-3-deoxygalactonokinase [Brevundimonas sp. VNH65]|uniref:2-dehydro-3-deoxygalactonokinase n=1 Tax=Brevundimonas sp. VNH65 TaxID=3400917 RepID=UPI003C12109E
MKLFERTIGASEPGADPAQACALVGVDWGSSNLRVMQIGQGGEILGVRTDPRGASLLSSADFPGVLSQVGEGWVEHAPVLVCGMAGARGKWREASYSPCPAGISDLFPVTLDLDGVAARLVPGVSLMLDGGLTDVMRGEETQVMGVGDADGLIVTPGTHCKWARVSDGRIIDFRTFMTGELFRAIRAETMLGVGMDETGRDQDAFMEGVQRALDDPAITAALFSVRIETLAGRLQTTSAADYLSGLLIGAEVSSQKAQQGRTVTLVGAAALTSRYARALEVAGFTDVRVLDGLTATAAGLWRIHQAHPA